MPPARSIARFVAHFATTYATAFPGIMYRLTASCLLDPQGSQRFLHDVLDARDFREDDRVLRTVDVTDIFPGEEELVIKGPYQTASSSETRNSLELGCLAHVVKSLDACKIFEIGTYIGRTTRLFALNTRPDARIYTLDLPRDCVEHRVGKDFEATPEAAKIVQLSGDSRTFDYGPFHGGCDFVWVDGCHDYEFVAADTAHAMRVCRPGGWIGWHDYRHTAGWSGVTRLVREVAGRFQRIHHVRGTTVCLGQYDPR